MSNSKIFKKIEMGIKDNHLEKYRYNYTLDGKKTRSNL